MEYKDQRNFLILVVAILIINSVTLFGILSILSDHEISRISSSVRITPVPTSSITAPKPATLVKDVQDTGISPQRDLKTGNLAAGFPSDRISDSSPAGFGGTLQNYPDIGLMSELLSERSGIQRINELYQNPTGNARPVVANSSDPIQNNTIMKNTSVTGSGALGEILSPTPLQNTNVTLIYVEKKRPPSNYAMPEELPDIEVPLLPIYVMKDEDTSKVLPEIQYDLNYPPLIIKSDVTPFNITRIKHLEYTELSTKYNEDLVFERPSELAWFEISVRNLDTGEIVEEVGYGREYGQQPLPQITIRKAGRYSILLEGEFMKINSIEIDVKRDGNVPSDPGVV